MCLRWALYLAQVRKQMVWDEQREQWVLQALSPSVNKIPLKRPVSASTQKRPVSDYAKIASAMGDQVRVRLTHSGNIQLTHSGNIQ
jgi:hypothetical protein